MGRQTKKDRTVQGLAFILLATGLFVVAIWRGDISMALWGGLSAFTLILLFIGLQLPTRCGVITNKGTPCRNRTNGVFFGCANARGHMWEKFAGRFRPRQTVPPMPPSPQPAAHRSRSSATAAEVTSVPVTEGKAQKVLFWLTCASGSAALISMVTDVIGLFRG